MWRYIVLLSVTWMVFGLKGTAGAEPLQVLYIDYPPYYYTSADGTPQGLVVDIASKVFAQAGVDYEYVYAPSKRVINAMYEGQPVASLGWFKTEERKAFANFSLPLYVNLPLRAVVLRRCGERFSGYDTLDSLLSKGHFLVGCIDGHSYGQKVDQLLEAYPNQSVSVAAEQSRLLTMLAAERFDFLLMPPEEVEMLALASGLEAKELMLLPLTDIPGGNARYIMYSKSVDPGIIRKVDWALHSQTH